MSQQGSSTIDYKRLGETTGKAWRLGHVEASGGECISAIRHFSERLKVPQGQEQTDFTVGFASGVAAVDKERAKA